MAGKRLLNLPTELLPEQPPELPVQNQPAASSPPAAPSSPRDDAHYVDPVSGETVSELRAILNRPVDPPGWSLSSRQQARGEPGHSDGLLPGNPFRRPDPIRQAEFLYLLSYAEQRQHLARLANEDPEYLAEVRQHLEALKASNERANRIQAERNVQDAARKIREYIEHERQLQAGQPKQASVTYPNAPDQANEMLTWTPEERYAWIQRMRQDNPGWAEEVGRWYNMLRQEIENRDRNIPVVSEAPRFHVKKPAVIRTYADLTASLAAKTEQARSNAQHGAPEQQTILIFKDGQITSENKRRPHVGDIVLTEDGREVGVITRVRANMGAPWEADLRAPTGYHLGGIRVP